MAISLRIFSSFLAGETAMLAKSSSSIRIVAPAFHPSHANVRTVGTVTYAAASKLEIETKKREPIGIMNPRRVLPKMQAFLGGVPEILTHRPSWRFGPISRHKTFRAADFRLQCAEF